MVTKVGIKVPIILPIVLNAPKVPTVFPLSSRLSTVYFTKEGVTVPSKNRGYTKITIQATNPANMRKLLLTVIISTAEIASMIYFPTTGMAAIHMAAIISRVYSLSGFGFLSALRPPQIFPRAMAIMIVPMIIVQTICEELK
ncbi:hypothetical protein IMSAGC002_04632 [Lachnospiraceae bacterium]|nr:hypothetical protein IMSAGC002_04632 [Lachnospiraceae bacterium]